MLGNCSRFFVHTCFIIDLTVAEVIEEQITGFTNKAKIDQSLDRENACILAVRTLEANMSYGKICGIGLITGKLTIT